MKLSRTKREALTDLWLAGPATLALFVFIFLPVAIVAVLSFTDYQFGARTFDWSGFDNYVTLFSSSIGRRAITNTLIYVAIVIPFSVGFGLLVAVGLYQMTLWAPRWSNAFKTIYFLPVAATLVAMSVAWQMVLHPTLGIVNQTLFSADLPTPNWLSDRSLVLYTLAMIGIWQSIGYNMVLFLAGLAAIPAELYDAAEVDGAGGSWSRFETVATMTKGGPAFASDTLVYALYREGFIYFKAGYASAITMVFFAFLLALAVIQFRVVARRVHYR